MQSEQVLRMRDENNPQQYGSSLTYARRYALAAIFNLNQEDDDGNSAAGHKVKAVKEWLNKEHGMWVHATEHMQKGKPIADIEKHYLLSKEIKSNF